MHAKGWGAHGTFSVTNDITRYTKLDSGGRTRRGGCRTQYPRLRGKFYTEEGNWDIGGNNTPVVFFRDPLRFSDLNHAIKRDPRTGLRSADNNWTSGRSCPRRCTR